MRLSRAEIDKLRLQLTQWQTPETMLRLVDDTMTRMGAKDLFNQSGLAFLRDAWVAADFGRIRQAHQARIVADTWPDFDLEVEGRVESFEAVEADDPERRRGNEFREGLGEIEDDPVEDWVARAEQAPAWLEAACFKKFNKQYGGRANLVIYLNVNEFGIRQQNVESSFPKSTESVKDSFKTVWVLWKDRAYLVWSGGQLHRSTVISNAL